MDFRPAVELNSESTKGFALWILNKTVLCGNFMGLVHPPLKIWSRLCRCCGPVILHTFPHRPSDIWRAQRFDIFWKCPRSIREWFGMVWSEAVPPHNSDTVGWATAQALLVGLSQSQRTEPNIQIPLLHEDKSVWSNWKLNTHFLPNCLWKFSKWFPFSWCWCRFHRDLFLCLGRRKRGVHLDAVAPRRPGLGRGAQRKPQFEEPFPPQQQHRRCRC